MNAELAGKRKAARLDWPLVKACPRCETHAPMGCKPSRRGDHYCGQCGHLFTEPHYWQRVPAPQKPAASLTRPV